MAPPEGARPWYRRLRELRDELPVLGQKVQVAVFERVVLEIVEFVLSVGADVQLVAPVALHDHAADALGVALLLHHLRVVAVARPVVLHEARRPLERASRTQLAADGGKSARDHSSGSSCQLRAGYALRPDTR